MTRAGFFPKIGTMREKVFSVVIALFLLSSLAPAFYEIVHSDRLQPNREFELVHNFPTDFNFYLSRIRQGIEGRLTVKEQYTSEPHNGSFIHVFYLWLGWLGRWSRVPWHRAADVYHMARIVFGGLLLVMIAEYANRQLSGFGFRFSDIGRSVFSRSVTGKPKTDKHETENRQLRTDNFWAVLAFLLAVTASTWPKLLSLVNDQIVPATSANLAGWRFGGYMPWWSVMDSLQRITFIPHLLVGQALILFLIMALSDEATMKKPGNWIFLGVLAFMLGIIFPPGLLFVIVTCGVSSLFELLMSSHSRERGNPVKNEPWTPAFAGVTTIKQWAFHYSIPRVVVLVLGLPSLIYLSLMTSFYPWKRLAEFDIIKPLPFQYGEYLLAVGPILPIGVIGLIAAVMSKDRRMLPAVAWVIAWAGLLFIFKFIPQQSPLRFSEMIPHVPLGVLASYVFYKIYNRYNNYKYYIFALPAVLIVVSLGVMYSSFLWQKDFVDHKMRATYPLVPTGSYVMYPLKDFIAAARFIQDATSRDTVILSETTAGNYLPVVSGNTVYVGHANTVKAEEKEALVKAFFSGTMSTDDARVFLTRENLQWIFFGPQEKEDGGVGNLATIYPFLTEAYKNSFVTIYTVR